MEQHSHWYYILGYLIVLTNHNWPVMIALGASAYYGWRLYRKPSLRNVRFLYGWALLGLAYEYVKHLGPYFSQPVWFLFTTDWAWMHPAAFVIEFLPPPIMIVLAVILLFKALWSKAPAADRGATQE